jgi:hypothetical protein
MDRGTDIARSQNDILLVQSNKLAKLGGYASVTAERARRIAVGIEKGVLLSEDMRASMGLTTLQLERIAQGVAPVRLGAAGRGVGRPTDRPKEYSEQLARTVGEKVTSLGDLFRGGVEIREKVESPKPAEAGVGTQPLPGAELFEPGKPPLPIYPQLQPTQLQPTQPLPLIPPDAVMLTEPPQAPETVVVQQLREQASAAPLGAPQEQQRRGGEPTTNEIKIYVMDSKDEILEIIDVRFNEFGQMIKREEYQEEYQRTMTGGG